MAVNTGYKQFPKFDVRNDPEMVYAHFIKCQAVQGQPPESLEHHRRGSATAIILTGFVPFFEQNIQGLFKDTFPIFSAKKSL